jgi:Peptidase family M1 domain/Secretion system C-terminal sorting domain/Peptidase M1 N-terminal domain
MHYSKNFLQTLASFKTNFYFSGLLDDPTYPKTEKLTVQLSMKQLTITLFAALCLLSSAHAQLLPDEYEQFRNAEAHHHSNAALHRDANATATGNNLNVTYQRYFWRINPDSVKYIRGWVTTHFTTTVPNVSSITLDMKNNLTIDSIKFRNVRLAAGNYSISAAHVLTINLGTTITTVGSRDSVLICYRGAPTTYVSGDEIGFVRTTHGSPAQNYIYTLSESFEDRDWFPCKADLNDKIDSIDIFVSTPNTFTVAANGALVSETAVAGSNRITYWKHRKPIPSYLICLGVANYVKVNSGTASSNGTLVPIVHYLFPENNTAGVITAFDKCKSILTTLSTWLGDYPYEDEKYGHYNFGFPGGMEHATFSGMGTTSWSVVAHELGHQWFGDKVTCATWNDIWVQEGLAVYMEILAAEKASGATTTALARRTAVRTSARSASTLSPYLTAANTSTDVFGNTARYYDRGGMIISMLRALVGDTKFFQALQNYLNDPLLAYKAASTDDVKRHFEAVSGLNLTNFFNQWVYGAGNPAYTVQWGNNNTNITFQLAQTRSGGNPTPPSYFDMPVVLRISNAGGTIDTTVVIFDQGGTLSAEGNRGTNNTLTFNLSFVPATVTFDPELLTMATGTVSFLKVLDVKIEKFTGVSRGNVNELNLEITKTPELREVTLEKSRDGNSFEVAGTMVNNGGNTNSTSYNYFDNSPYAGTTYYRAKFNNVDGSVVYSTVISIATQQKGAQLLVAPNPAVNFVNIQVPQGGVNEKWKLRIMDMKGAVVFETNNANNNSNALRLNVSDWQSGVYIVRLDKENGVTATTKFTVNR